jgi:hypothetical protein
VVTKLMKMLLVSKQATKKCDMSRFHLKKMKGVVVKIKYQENLEQVCGLGD